MIKNLNYTVLGAGGFIGGKLVAKFGQSGLKCYTPQRDDPAIFKNDLGRVFYCIGLTADYRQRPFDTVEAHASLISRILKEARFEKLVYLSSTRLYDGLKGDTCLESDNLSLNPAHPRHLYDFSKGLGENLCLTASDGRACVARLSGVYDFCAEATGFLPEILRRLPSEREFILDSNSGIVRDYICIKDVLDSLIAMMDHSGCEIVNVASGENISNQDIADVLNQNGFNVSLRGNSPRETPPRCDISKLKSLGIHPTSVPDYLRRFIKDMKHGNR